LPVVLVDTGDNVGGGSAGDGTRILAELLRQGATDAVTCLYAPQEVRECVQAGVGGTVQLKVGGKGDRLDRAPVGGGGGGVCVRRWHVRRGGGASRRQTSQSHGPERPGGDGGAKPAGAELTATSAVQPGAADLPGNSARDAAYPGRQGGHRLQGGLR